MTTDLARTKLNNSLQKGSLDALVKERNQRSLLLVDVSGSMRDCTLSGERKIDALRKVVTTLRETHPVPVAAFGLAYDPNGAVGMVDTIPEPQGMTPMHEAFNFGKREGATHLVLVTDGLPDSKPHALDAAKRFGGVIDTFYIGDPNGEGADFCRQIAEATGGSSNVTDLGKPKQLATKIAGLLPAAPKLLEEPKKAVLL
jgi:Mg-chelatase subunit ChlD